jgi:hypothetical protein
MARPAQRYIEPDAIYMDLQRGAPTQIPAEFGWTWNPVNGLGASDATSANVIDDVFSSIVRGGGEVVDDTRKNVEDKASSGIEDFLNSTPGRALLDKVKSKAEEGVTEVVKENAPHLMILAVAGGAVGGALSAKLGKIGTVGAIALALFAGHQLLNAKVPAKK